MDNNIGKLVTYSLNEIGDTIDQDGTIVFKKPPPSVRKNFEIWLGYYSHGQGHEPYSKPKKIADVKATTFRVACVLYEHQSAINDLQEQMDEGLHGIDNESHFGTWYYHPESNANSWLGAYYESEEEAWKSFTKRDET